jgi:transposase
MNVRYRVELTQYERSELLALLNGGKHPARKLKRAQILLAADTGVSDVDIATSVGVGGSTIYRTKRRFVEGNLERALSEEALPGAERKLTGKEEALLVATACSSPPAGRARWTLTLLADALVKLTPRESLSRETVRRRLPPSQWRSVRTTNAIERLHEEFTLATSIAFGPISILSAVGVASPARTGSRTVLPAIFGLAVANLSRSKAAIGVNCGQI